MIRFLAVSACAFMLTNCATPAQVESMVPTIETQLPANSPLAGAVLVNAITGGENTNPLWTSEVGNAEFQGALTQTLTDEGMLAEGAARYRLDATLMEVDQPFIGFAYTVGSTVRYVVTEIAPGDVIFDEIVTAEYTAELSESFLGVERLRLANEGSIRNNISEFVRQLIDSAGNAGTPISSLELGNVG